MHLDYSHGISTFMFIHNRNAADGPVPSSQKNCRLRVAILHCFGVGLDVAKLAPHNLCSRLQET
jgi:Tat protein secretion system quality control protein TatD with DNase activity